MKAPRIRFSFAAMAIVALSATPNAAATVEEAVVPPSNSAATQYTETFPTSGGDKKTDRKPSHRSPEKVLGKHNAKKLQKQGPEGEAAAEAAAATAPSSIGTPPAAPAPSTQGDSAGRGGGNGEGEANAPRQRNPASGGATTHSQVSQPDGSSGIGAAIGQATGLSSAGGSGPLLPLVIFATLLWSLAYFWRQRRQVG